ncbi:MAG: carboxymuconolactone decarboxylase family protein [Nitrospirae bacterium]|nr:carboxymuconolactone decarboxylase family protein [Nitrospirota bacterium]
MLRSIIGLSSSIVLLIYQINGCAHCLEMHTKDAIALGEDQHKC